MDNTQIGTAAGYEYRLSLTSLNNLGERELVLYCLNRNQDAYKQSYAVRDQETNYSIYESSFYSEARRIIITTLSRDSNGGCSKISSISSIKRD